MSIKKKLGLGVASAAIGLSLIGGGTWAAFNDTATISNHFAAGTLDLEVGKSGTKPINFDLTNMKPGDNVQRIFKLKNKGTLAIKEVLLNVSTSNFTDDTTAVNGGTNSEEEFLSQFVVDFMAVDSESTSWEPRGQVVATGQTLTLADLVAGPTVYASKVNSAYLSNGVINLAPLTVAASGLDYRGIPVNPVDSDDVFIQITFKPNSNKEANGEYTQNKFQGDSVKFYFNLEATQWDGVNVDTHNGNGAVNNGKQGTSEGGTLPTGTLPTTGTPTITAPLED
jgi:spore coat-associated protein N